MSAWFRFCICSFEGTMNEYSSLAQSVEHAAVNRSVVGSSPTGGAFLFGKPSMINRWFFVYTENKKKSRLSIISINNKGTV